MGARVRPDPAWFPPVSPRLGGARGRRDYIYIRHCAFYIGVFDPIAESSISEEEDVGNSLLLRG